MQGMRFLRTNPPPTRTLQAAHTGPTSNGTTDPKNHDQINQRTHDWQTRILTYKDAIPEMAAAGSFIRNTINRVQYKTTIPEGDIKQTVERRINDFQAGRAAEQIFYTGETVISYLKVQDGLKWSTYSQPELDFDKNKQQILVLNQAGKHVPAQDGEQLFRVYQPDASNRFLAYSTHKSMLDLLEAFWMYQLVDIAISQSRLAGAGILYVPSDGMSDEGPDPSGRYPEGSMGETATNIVKAMTESLKNRKANEVFVPYLHFGPAEKAEAFRHIMLERTDDPAAFARRMETYRERYAAGIDLPKEIVLGSGDANHWTAWKIDDNTWQYHLYPLADILGQALLDNFAKPFAAQLGYTGDFELEPDGTAIVSKPDQTEVGLKLSQQDRLTNEGIAEILNIDPSFVKDPENPQPTGMEDLLVDSTRTTPSLMSQATIRGQLTPELLAVPDRYALQDEVIRAKFIAALQEHIPGIVEARLEQLTADTLEQRLTTLQTLVRTLSDEDVRARISIIEASLGLTPGSLLSTYDREVAARAARAQAIVTAYVNFVANEERVKKQAGPDRDKTPPIVRAGAEYRPHTGLVRALVDVQNGGQGRASSDYMRIVTRPADVNTDRIVAEPLDQRGIERNPVYEWVYGDPSTRFQPFPDHVALAGTTWTRFQEAQTLHNDGANEASIWFPGDHEGCQCSYSIRWS